MNADQYLSQVLSKVRHPTGFFGPGNTVRTQLLPYMQEWGSTQLLAVDLSGSYAKNTAIFGGSDVDLFISLHENTKETLKALYDMLARFMGDKGFVVRKQNVSINVRAGSYSVDLVPGKRQGSLTTDHSIYVSRLNTWTKTNIQTHISHVVNLGRTDEICLLKHWRALQRLEFPSFALELATVRALQGHWQGLSSAMVTVLEFLRDNIKTAALPDPANGSNNVAAELTVGEKAAISSAAAASLAKKTWGEVVW